jgi:hypothetical protein
MLSLKHLLFLTLIVLCLSCQNEHGYNYAIKDFRKTLQPFLFNIVSKGIVRYYDSSQTKNITDNELIRLSKSENPVLRATACRELLERDTFNHFNLLINHLDDTAIVATNAGEFGIWYRTVSDDILQEAIWKTREEKDKTVEQVLTQHNYLRSAYTILRFLEPKEKYYPYIKDMATRPRRLSDDEYELDFDDIEYALYGLAKFKKQDDVKIIKKQMMQNVWQISGRSFKLMEEFPDTAYFDVLQTYHRRKFYKFSGNRRDGFSGFIADRADPEDFIQALVIQQNENSAKLLDTILNRLPLQTCMPDKENIINEVITAIWEHPCSSYTRLREKIKPKAEEILKRQISIPLDSFFTVPINTTKKIIRWY